MAERGHAMHRLPQQGGAPSGQRDHHCFHDFDHVWTYSAQWTHTMSVATPLLSFEFFDTMALIGVYLAR